MNVMKDNEIEISIKCDIEEVSGIYIDGSYASGCRITLHVDSTSGIDYLFTNENNFYIHTYPKVFTEVERERHHGYSMPYNEIFEDSYEDYIRRIEREIEYEKR